MKARLAALVLVGVLASSGCGQSLDPEEEASLFLTTTQEEPRQFTYQDRSRGLTTKVQASVEDGFRFEAGLSVEDTPVLDQIFSDDTLAAKVHAPDRVPQLANISPEDVEAANALKAGEWVIDPAGAPPLALGSAEARNIGENPLLDALSVFDYVRLAMRQAALVREFNPDAQDYNPSEDPFPHPVRDRGEKRYDLVPTPLPQAKGGQLPGTPAFRLLSIYVRGGKIFRVLERIDILDHPEIKRARRTGKNPYLLTLARAILEGKGPERVRQRTMSVEIDVVDKLEPIALPEGKTANLRGIFGGLKTVTPPSI